MSNPKRSAIALLAAAIVAAAAAERAARADDQLAHNTAATAAPARAAHAAPIELDRLDARLREMPALGLLTKLRFRAELDTILDGLEAGRRGGDRLDALRTRFLLLADEAAGRLNDGDPDLARTIAAGREAIWLALVERHGPPARRLGRR